jgi:hypothetical protein
MPLSEQPAHESGGRYKPINLPDTATGDDIMYELYCEEKDHERTESR